MDQPFPPEPDNTRCVLPFTESVADLVRDYAACQESVAAGIAAGEGGGSDACADALAMLDLTLAIQMALGLDTPRVVYNALLLGATWNQVALFLRMTPEDARIFLRNTAETARVGVVNAGSTTKASPALGLARDAYDTVQTLLALGDDQSVNEVGKPYQR